jgi:hypothetical protein
MAFGFVDSELPPSIGEFTYKYRTKSRFKDTSSVNKWSTKESRKELVKFHRCSEREANWGTTDHPL